MKLLLLNIMTALGLHAPPALVANSQSRILLTAANTVTFRGEVSQESTTRALLQLTTLVRQRGRQTYPIYLVLDSPGGSIAAGEDFIDYVKTLPNVHTISLFAASMASAIVEGLPGRRYVTPNAILMFHRAKGQFQGQFETGEVESELALFQKYVRNMEQRSADRIGIKLADYKARVLNEWWIQGSDNISQGTADQIVDLECSPQLTDQRQTVTSTVLIFTVKEQFSGCPLIRGPVAQESQE